MQMSLHDGAQGCAHHLRDEITDLFEGMHLGGRKQGLPLPEFDYLKSVPYLRRIFLKGLVFALDTGDHIDVMKNFTTRISTTS
jgi:hypothetical protein